MARPSETPLPQSGAYFALDQDAESLPVVRREQGELGVIPVHAPIKSLLRGAITFANLDLVYAAGLYDYLLGETAVALSCGVTRLLAPGGRVLIANVVPENEGTGYMEAFMDWHLIYRDEGDIGEIVKQPGELIETCRTYRDPDENIVFWECRKAV